jgi:hypothetical protein
VALRLYVGAKTATTNWVTIRRPNTGRAPWHRAGPLKSTMAARW